MLVQQQIDALFAGAIAHGAGITKAVPAQAPTMKKCSRKKCKHMFSITDERKTCPMCRERVARHSKTSKGKATRKRIESSEKGKESRQKRHKRWYDKGGKEIRKKYDQSEEGKAAIKKWQKSDAGKASFKRRNSKPMNRMAMSLWSMVTGTHENPVTFGKLGIFVNNAEAQAHFESTFAPWMAWENLGKRLKSTLPNTKWQLGHRIPKVWYRHRDVNEVKKAWSRVNLCAQCAVENNAARDRNILTREQWLSLKAIWPKQCAQKTDEEAWVWARDNVDNATRKAKRKAAAGPSNLNATFETESDDSD